MTSGPDPRRSLLLCGLGAVLGLVLAGYALFTSDGTRTAHVAPENAAMVNGVPILMIDYVAHLKALHEVSLAGATPAQKREALDDMIREELFVQRGLELGMPSVDAETRTVLVSAVEGALATEVNAARPDEAELRAHYDANRETYSTMGVMTLSDLIAPPTRAAAAVAELRAGLPPAEAMRRHGLRSSGKVDDGAQFYFAAEARLGKTLYRAARRLDPGQVSDPIVTDDGAHILVMHGHQRPRPERFEAMRARVGEDLAKARLARLTTDSERFLRKRADIRVAPALQ